MCDTDASQKLLKTQVQRLCLILPCSYSQDEPRIWGVHQKCNLWQFSKMMLKVIFFLLPAQAMQCWLHELWSLLPLLTWKNRTSFHKCFRFDHFTQSSSAFWQIWMSPVQLSNSAAACVSVLSTYTWEMNSPIMHRVDALLQNHSWPFSHLHTVTHIFTHAPLSARHPAFECFRK